MASAMKSRITIEVTEEDIERAKVGDSYKCVVSQAIARTIPDATRIDSDIQTIRFSLPDERWTFLTPYAVQGYIVAFDAGDPIEPFSFQLRDPKKVARKLRTPAGKEVMKAESKVRRLKGALKATDPASAELKESLSEAEEKLEGVKTAYSASKKSSMELGARLAPPRTFKKKTRTYGHRDLRINKTYYRDEEDLIQARFPEKA